MSIPRILSEDIISKISLDELKFDENDSLLSSLFESNSESDNISTDAFHADSNENTKSEKKLFIWIDFYSLSH